MVACPVQVVTDHQKRAAIGRVQLPLPAEAGLFVGADCARVGGIRIGEHARRARPQQAIDERADECRAVAAAQHVRLADELVDAARARRMRAETIHALLQGALLEIAAHKRELLVRLSPPFAHMRVWSSQASHHRQVVRTASAGWRTRSAASAEGSSTRSFAAVERLEDDVGVGVDADLGGNRHRLAGDLLGADVGVDQRARGGRARSCRPSRCPSGRARAPARRRCR